MNSTSVNTGATITTLGTVGQPTRMGVTGAGNLVNPNGTPRLNWYIAAGDRWHTPAQEAAVRQQRLGGTAVTETRVKVPNGDVVQRVYAVADGGGIAVIEVENESTLPVAIAFDRRDVLTERPIPGTPVEGIDLPTAAFVAPLGHKATLRIGVAFDGRTGSLPSVAAPGDVVRGWKSTVERAGAFMIPDVVLSDRVTAARIALILDGVPAVDDAPTDFLFGVDQMVRMAMIDRDEPLSGDKLDDWIPDVAAAVQQVAANAGRSTDGWLVDAALAAAQRVLLAADEGRAVRDLAKITGRRDTSELPRIAPVPESDAYGLHALAWLERTFVSGNQLVPNGVPAEWFGQSFECRSMPTAGAATVGYAVRWHARRPAVLWEQSPPPIELVAPAADPDWRTDAVAGEALWQPVAMG